MIRALALFLATILSLPSHSATPAKGDYQRIQAMRAEAGKLANAGGDENLRKAAAKLEEALALLAQPDVAERSTGWAPLYARNHDVRMDLATVYALAGDKERALAALESMQFFVTVGAMADMLDRQPGLASLRDEPRFKAVVARDRQVSRLWKSPAIATAYKDKLTVEERIAGLSLYWAEAREHFAWFGNQPDLDWGAVYMEFLPKVMAAETTRDYYAVMMQLAPRLRDGHTNIYAPRELQDEFYARPPLRTRLVEGRVIVSEVLSARLAERVKVGDEVVAIDGMPSRRYAEERVRPFASASTPQDLAVRMYTYQLFSGPATRPVRVRLAGPDGRERDEEIARTGYDDVKGPEPFQFRTLPGGIAYLSLDSFESDAVVKAFVAALPRIMEAKGLVLDVRRNGGGSSNFGLDILTYLVRGSIPESVGYVRTDQGARRSDAIRWSPDWQSGGSYERKRERIFEGPVAVLVGPQTFSAAEDFLVSFDLLNRGPMVGEASGGSTGQPMMVALPGGGVGRICAKRDTYPDGRNFVGVGIAPTIVVKPTVEDIRAGRDPVLERAAEALVSAASKS